MTRLTVLVLAGAAVAASAAAFEPPSPYATPRDLGQRETELPEGEGREEVEGICAACHSIRMVTQQRLPRHRWDELLDWMVAEQGMPELDEETRTVVLDYLSDHLGTGEVAEGR